jgi:hypothetical protein
MRASAAACPLCRAPLSPAVAAASELRDLAYDQPLDAALRERYPQDHSRALEREAECAECKLIESLPLVSLPGSSPHGGFSLPGTRGGSLRPRVNGRGTITLWFNDSDSDAPEVLARADKVGLVFGASRTGRTEGMVTKLERGKYVSPPGWTHRVFRARLAVCARFALVGDIRRDEHGTQVGTVELTERDA